MGQLPALAARFANAAQCPAEAAEKLQYLIFPITEVESIPEAWRGKTLLELPRVMFGRLEQKTAARLDALQDAGCAGAVINNPAQLRYTDGWTPVSYTHLKSRTAIAVLSPLMKAFGW